MHVSVKEESHFSEEGALLGEGMVPAWSGVKRWSNGLTEVDQQEPRCKMLQWKTHYFACLFKTQEKLWSGYCMREETIFSKNNKQNKNTLKLYPKKISWNML